VIGASMAAGRPPVQTVNSEAGPTSWYAIKSDHTMLADRYNLIGLVALAASGSQPRIPGKQREAELPIVVITVMNGAGRLPRDALACIFKNWRRRFAPFFRSVYVSFSEHKGTGLASYVDDAVNKTTYKLVLLDDFSGEEAALRTLPWHWDSQELKMSCARSHMEHVAKLCRKIPPSQNCNTILANTHPIPASDINIAVIQDTQDNCLFSDSARLRSATSDNLSALHALEASQRSLKRGQSGVEDEKESDLDDEPPDTQTNSSSAQALQLSANPSPAINVSEMTSPCLTEASDLGDLKSQMRKDSIINAKVLIGQNSGAATMSSLYLAGGLKGMLGYEKTASKDKSNSRGDHPNDSKSKKSVAGESAGNPAKGKQTAKKSPQRKGTNITSDKSGFQSISEEFGGTSLPPAISRKKANDSPGGFSDDSTPLAEPKVHDPIHHARDSSDAGVLSAKNNISAIPSGRRKSASDLLNLAKHGNFHGANFALFGQLVKTGAVEFKDDEGNEDNVPPAKPQTQSARRMSKLDDLDMDIFAEGNIAASLGKKANETQEDLRAKARAELMHRHAPAALAPSKAGHRKHSIETAGSSIIVALRASAANGATDNGAQDDLASRFRNMQTQKQGI